MRAMPGIREEHEPGVGKLLLKNERIHGRDHDVVMTVHHESPVRDTLQRAVALAVHLPPCLQRGQLGGGDLRRCGGFPILSRSQTSSAQPRWRCEQSGITGEAVREPESRGGGTRVRQEDGWASKGNQGQPRPSIGHW
jgi:hypothetical protein